MITALRSASDLSLTHFDLGGQWTCRAVAGPIPDALAEELAYGIPGTVPGVVHLDLLAAGLIPDPYDGCNEQELTWIGRTDWEYTREFEWHDDGHRRHDILARGLDTVATLWLNDREIGCTANHHREYRLDVSDLLREGTNTVRIRFAAALTYAEEREAVLGVRPHSNPHPFNCIRKPAYSFGWDWGPELVTAGIWRPIAIDGSSAARFDDVRPLTSWSRETGAALDLHVGLAHASGAHTVHIEVADLVSEAFPITDIAHWRVGVPGAEGWWPRSHGAQPLYSTTITLLDPDGATVDTWHGNLGFRSVTVDTSPDEEGNRFNVVVNGSPIHIRGANWIPADTFLPRVDQAALRSALADAVDSHINLIRVWGGGIYETDEFYELCDELGLLVWQDFALACAAYSEDAELWQEMEAEARQAIARVSAHPSLALWNGGNENIWGWADWGWRAALDGATWGEGYYTRLFPELVTELAPGTPYLEGSPFSFDKYLHPNDPASGCIHIWDVWNTADYLTYRDYRPRFVSEFGFQGPPAFSTLESVVRDEPRSPHGEQMLVHQKAVDGNLKLERGLGSHLPLPADYIDWHWATQLNQARALRFGIEHFRSLAPYNTGAVVWQLNDCWPVVSWAAVDGRGIRKPLWYALRDAFTDRLATIQPRSDGLALVLHNETDEVWQGSVEVRRALFDGAPLAGESFPVDVPARGEQTIPLPPRVAAADAPGREFIVADLVTGERALWYFAEDPELALASDAVVARAEQVADGYEVSVTAGSLVKDLTLLVDHLDANARVDAGLVTLLPGESTRFHVTSAIQLDLADLVSRPVLRSANDLVSGTSRPPQTERLEA